jgi:hypothetical protein
MKKLFHKTIIVKTKYEPILVAEKISANLEPEKNFKWNWYDPDRKKFAGTISEKEFIISINKKFRYVKAKGIIETYGTGSRIHILFKATRQIYLRLIIGAIGIFLVILAFIYSDISKMDLFTFLDKLLFPAIFFVILFIFGLIRFKYDYNIFIDFFKEILNTSNVENIAPLN